VCCSKKDNDKKEKKLEETVKNSAKEFQAVKMKANMVTGLVNLLVLNRLLAAFEGQSGGQLLLLWHHLLLVSAGTSDAQWA
jgi:hypothetical protein